MTQPVENDNLILLVGDSGTGKTQSLKNIKNPEGVMYLNCEAGKKVPFRNCKFKQYKITKPHEVPLGFTAAETMPEVHTIVIDTIDMLMAMFESAYIVPAPKAKTFDAWNQYSEYVKTLMQKYVAESTKNVIIIGHTLGVLDEGEGVIKHTVPVKGQVKNTGGIEAYFSVIIGAKKIPVTKLEEEYLVPTNTLLTLSDREKKLGRKYCYQTMVTKDTLGEKIRGGDEMWEDEETFIDSNIQHVLDRLHTYYADEAA